MYLFKATGQNYNYSAKLVSQSNSRSDARIEYVSNEKVQLIKPSKQLESTDSTVDINKAWLPSGRLFRNIIYQSTNPSNIQVLIFPLPFISTSPRSFILNLPSSLWKTFSVICISPAIPCDSIWNAVFTTSPQRS